MRRIDAEFFIRFPEGRCQGAVVAIVDTAAGETDVARLPAQLAAAHFEHDLFLPVFVNNRY